MVTKQRKKSVTEALLQAHVDQDLAQWVRKMAEKESISVSAWLRRLLTKTRSAH